MLITSDQLRRALTGAINDSTKAVDHLPVAEARLDLLEGPLNSALEEFEINTNYRVAAFLANAIIESDHLKTFKEYASGKDYEGRKDLGNTQPGDGVRFKGRGIIQLTGRNNYQACEDYFHLDLTGPKGDPAMLSDNVGLALRSGGWFWSVHIKKGLNRYADLGPYGFSETVYRVNGAVTAKRTHWPERAKYYRRILEVLGAADPGEPSPDHSAFHPKHAKRRHVRRDHRKTKDTSK